MASQKISRLKRSIKGYGALIRANEALNAQVAELSQEVIRLRELSIENERLRGLLSFKKKTPYKVIGVRVVGRDASNWYNTIVIDKGSNQNLVVGMALVAPSGLVGKVTEVGSSISRGMLILNPNSRVGAIVQRSRDEGVVEGSLKGLLRMKYISKDADLKAGDLVISSGLGGVFPKGVAIGKIKDIGTEADGLHLYAWVEPAVDFSKLEEVLCIVRDTPSLF